MRLITSRSSGPALALLAPAAERGVRRTGGKDPGMALWCPPGTIGFTSRTPRRRVMRVSVLALVASVSLFAVEAQTRE